MYKRIFLALCLVMVSGLACAGSIKVVTEEWPPYTYTEDCVVTGVVTEVVREALDRSAFGYTIEVFPFARSYNMAAKTPNVLIYPILRLPSREINFKWIKLEGLSVEMALFKPNFRGDIQLTCLDDARKYRIGVTRETSTHHYLLSKGFEEGVNLFPVNSEELNVLKSMPESRRIDLTTGDKLSLSRWLKLENMPSNYWVEQVPLFKEDLYMAFSASTPDEVVEEVRRAFWGIQQEGIEEIKNKYHERYRLP